MTLEINLLWPCFPFPPSFLKKEFLGSKSCGSRTFPAPWDFHGGVSQSPARVFASGMFFSPQRLHFIRTRALGTRCPVKTARISHRSGWTPQPAFPANWKSCFSLVKESFPCLVGGDGKILPCFGVREAEIPQLTQGKGTKRESEEFLLMHEPSWEICSNFCVEKLGCSHTELWGLSDLHTFSFHGFVGIFVPV